MCLTGEQNNAVPPWTGNLHFVNSKMNVCTTFSRRRVTTTLEYNIVGWTKQKYMYGIANLEEEKRIAYGNKSTQNVLSVIAFERIGTVGHLSETLRIAITTILLFSPSLRRVCSPCHILCTASSVFFYTRFVRAEGFHCVCGPERTQNVT